MTIEGQTDRPPSPKRLALITGGALALATVLVVGFVLPAEFHADPTGFGRATGLLKLGTPQPPKAEVVAAGTTANTRYYPTAYRSDEVEIPLAAGGDENRKDELEYKVRMKPGDSMVYAWSVPVPNPEEFYYDFHGETPAAAGAPAKVVEYKQSTGTSSNGVLIAPIPGVHGWYLQNQSVKPVVVKLKMSGFYELVPPGQYGNEARIKAKPVS
ncbi:MAG TPA: hypothetical protein VL358_11785 [Caulobacteraceae bacterium]|jgi:hypothetical protein|nr:hypothetical protein [Caulobacteraceae bacterium]